jgi:hypothetical protein
MWLAMLKNLKSIEDTKPALFSLLSTSGTLSGISIGLMGVVQNKAANGSSTIADDALLFSGLGFLSVCYMVFFALRHLDSPRLPLLIAVIDSVFLCSLTLVVLSGFVLTYQLM